MFELREALRRLHWGKYEIEAYCSLIERGSSTATDISVASNIPSGRVHNVLNKLIKKGAVKKGGGRPAKYDAQNPQHVLEIELDSLRDTCQEALKSIMPLWEARTEYNSTILGPSNVVGLSGIVNSIREMIDNYNEAAYIVLDDFSWVTHKDISRIETLVGNGASLSVIGTERDRSNLELLSSSGAQVFMSDDTPSKFCVVDGISVCYIIGHFESGAIMKDEQLGKILIQEFGKYKKKAKILEVDSIVV